jgi:sugar/nucleoside kinase (ribokinase family)
MGNLRSEDFAKRVNEKREFAPPLFEVATAADMCVDLILQGNTRPQFGQREQIVNSYCLELGGSANIFATQMAKLGARTAVLGYVGSDPFGDFILQRLMESGVDSSLVKRYSSIATGLGVTLAEPDDRAILTVLGSIDLSRPCDLPSSPRSISKHWHVASPFLLRGLRSAWPQFLGRAKADGLTVSLDPNWDPDETWEGIKELLPLVDVFLPNEAEATALTGLSDSIEAGCQLAMSCPLVVVKRGSRGAIAVREGRVWEIAASRVPTSDGNPVDTVGAGDNFDAGFLRAWMLGKEIDACLSLGSLCASASLSSASGIRGQWVESL